MHIELLKAFLKWEK